MSVRSFLKKNKKSFFLAVFAILFLFLIVDYSFSPVRTVLEKDQSHRAPISQKQKEHTPQITENSVAYSISIAYPVLSDDKGPLAEANKVLSDTFTTLVKAFKKDTEGTDTNGLPEEIASEKNELIVDYSDKSIYTSPRFVSLYMTVFEYSPGAAHPNSHGMTFTYDKEYKKFITLKDLYTTSPSFIAKLSSYVEKDVTKHLIEVNGAVDKNEIQTIGGQVHDGLSEGIQNFELFTLGDKGITFYFDPYVVASYVDGPQESFVPYDVIASFKK